MTASAGNDGAPVLLTLVENHQRNRLTTFFRTILAIPHAIALYILNLVLAVVIFLSWVAAIFTGRNPAGLRDFTIGTLRWQSRAYAYIFLLTDEYPPFSFDAGGYPVDIEVPAPGQLNRFAVFFRVILLIPATFVSIVVILGLYVMVILAWISGVFAGRVPEGIYRTIAGGIQYLIRYNAYYFLVTPTYPAQLFGPAKLLPAKI
jgi:hypothetical protein